MSAFYLRSRYSLKLRKARDNPPPPSSFLALISLSPIFFSLSWFTLAMKQQPPHYAARRSHLPPPAAHSVLSQRLFHHILSVTSGFPPLTHHLKIEISRLSKFRAVGTGGGGAKGVHAPPDFERSVNPISVMGGGLCPPYFGRSVHPI